MEELKTKKASEGKVFAYLDENNNEVVLGNILYLGIKDDGNKYYEIDDPSLVGEETNEGE